MRSGKGVCLPRDDHSGRLFQLKPPDLGLPIPKSIRFRAKGLTALVRQSQNMLFTQLLQFCWHRFRCQTVQPHCHLIHGPRFNLVARVRRGPAAAGRHSRTRHARLGAGRGPRGRLRIGSSKMCHESANTALCSTGLDLCGGALPVSSIGTEGTLDCLYFAQDAARCVPCETTSRSRSLFVRPQPNSSGALGAKIFVPWGTCPLTPTNWSTTVRMGASCAPCT